MNKTHNPAIQSWVESARSPETDFPLQNLPFGVFRRKGERAQPAVGVALGSMIIDIGRLHRILPFNGIAAKGADACTEGTLNRFLAAGQEVWSALRAELFDRFSEEETTNRPVLEQALVPMTDAEMLLPVSIGDYTDFYTSIFHATNVGSMFRPDNPLLPNFKHIPIAYHGRASSVVVTGTAVRRPSGQTKSDDAPAPSFGPTRLLDYEVEVGMVVGPGNQPGSPISIDATRSNIFGLCLLNDWSARDLQKWEYQPLGPFLAKNFATTISPWLVTLEALEPFRAPAFQRPAGDPDPLPYLSSTGERETGGIDITLEALISSQRMREEKRPGHRVSRGNFKEMYWTVGQMLAHHASNGCHMRPGDLLGSGTVSGPEKDQRGCLLELTWRGKEPITLPTGETRKFLEDGDEVTLRGRCERNGCRRIGFGECSGVILPASGGTS
ncbi:MAG: fumarylacetoacetase [Ignavibacteria bacterium]|nr:fumarylacetoacetase [Ignavibacteria bacterium]